MSFFEPLYSTEWPDTDEPSRDELRERARGEIRELRVMQAGIYLKMEFV